MKILLTGASGMVGGHILEYCLEENSITEVVSFGRKALDKNHPKLKHIVNQDFEDYAPYESEFENAEAAE